MRNMVYELQNAPQIQRHGNYKKYVNAKHKGSKSKSVAVPVRGAI